MLCCYHAASQTSWRPAASIQGIHFSGQQPSVSGAAFMTVFGPPQDVRSPAALYPVPLSMPSGKFLRDTTPAVQLCDATSWTAAGCRQDAMKQNPTSRTSQIQHHKQWGRKRNGSLEATRDSQMRTGVARPLTSGVTTSLQAVAHHV